MASMTAKKDAIQARMEASETPEAMEKWYQYMVSLDKELMQSTLAMAKDIVISIDGHEGDKIDIMLLVDAVTHIIQETIPQDTLLKK